MVSTPVVCFDSEAWFLLSAAGYLASACLCATIWALECWWAACSPVCLGWASTWISTRWGIMHSFRYGGIHTTHVRPTVRKTCCSSFNQPDRYVFKRSQETEEIKLLLADSSLEQTGAQQHLFALLDCSTGFLFPFCFLLSHTTTPQTAEKKNSSPYFRDNYAP